MIATVSRSQGAVALIESLRPTPVFDSYWRFAAERQAVLVRRLAKLPPHWTDDPILRKYKFTNAYRCLDRVSQFLLREVIYNDVLSKRVEDVVFRILLFKIFNRIETWTLLRREVGDPTWGNFNLGAYDAVLSKAMDNGQRVYSAAYIVPPVTIFGRVERKHTGHLMLLSSLMHQALPQQVAATSSLKSLFELLLEVPSFGPFLAYQYAIDLNYSAVTCHSESEFVVAGPGALDGIKKCFERPEGASASQVIQGVCDMQDEAFAARGLSFACLTNRPLQLIDCQNLFCEISKYARVAHPESAGTTGRTRIKQAFASTGELPSLFFPPKWNVPNGRFKAFENADEVLS